ncbi:hypothetical protein, partial [Legionella feeleii]|uniref:hypothetical protein n=1 Tax=Legionella feeleii TaxID=453 RepID=UPI001A951ADC
PQLPYPANLKPSLKKGLSAAGLKITLSELSKSGKIKIAHPAGISKGAIYKLRLCLLFNQKIGFERCFP